MNRSNVVPIGPSFTTESRVEGPAPSLLSSVASYLGIDLKKKEASKALKSDFSNSDSSPRTQPYKYRAIKGASEIRLFTFKNERPSDDIHIGIEYANIDDLPIFECISYTWGTNPIGKQVYCNRKRINITENLEQALLRLRAKAGVGRRFWADQICIDQANPTEKSAQVSLMSTIFPSCTRVICWLGEEDEHTSSAFEILRAWAKAEKDEKLRTQLSRDLSLDAAGDALSHVAKRAALSSFFSRPWFRRAWILQEVFVSFEKPPIIICGSYEMGWHTLCLSFFAICTTLGRHEPAIILGDNVRFVLAMFNMYFLRGSDRITLSNLMQQASQREATDPRDRVFAMLGIMEQQGFHYPKPDYGMTKRQVFVKYTRAMIEQDQNLDVLSIRRRTWEGDDLPSWVLTPGRINFNVSELLARGARPAYDHGCVTGYSKPMVVTPVSEFDEELLLHGHSIDRVFQVHDLTTLRGMISPNSGKRWRVVIEDVRDLVETLNWTKTYARTGEDLFVACLRTLVVDDFYLACAHANNDYDVESGKLYHRYLQDRPDRNLRDIRDAGPGTERESQASGRTAADLYELARSTFRFEHQNSEQSPVADPGIIKWMDSVVTVDLTDKMFLETSGTCLAVTQSNLIALVPNTSKVGDEVCLLMGGFVPFILREAEEPGKHILIGGAYVHGLSNDRGVDEEMNTLKDHAPGNGGLTTFCLK